jgi:sulfonate transport system permease protein
MTDRMLDGVELHAGLSLVRPALYGRTEHLVRIDNGTQKRLRWPIPRQLRRMTGVLLIMAAWWVGVIPASVFPSPQQVGGSLVDLISSGMLLNAIQTSLWRVIIGLAIGGMAGIGLAVLSGIFKLGEDLVDAPIQMFRTMPWVGLTPLLIIWFGLGEAPKIALVAIAVSFPLYLNTYGGIRNVDVNLVEAAQTLGLSRFGLVRHVILPSALPNTLIGLRWALGSAWLALIFGEAINATSGLGFLMNRARDFLDLNVVVICLLVYALLGLGADIAARLLERFLLPWRSAFVGR